MAIAERVSGIYNSYIMFCDANLLCLAAIRLSETVHRSNSENFRIESER